MAQSIEKKAAVKKKYYLENKEIIKVKQKEWRDKNKEEKKEYDKKNRIKITEQVRERRRKISAEKKRLYLLSDEYKEQKLKSEEKKILAKEKAKEYRKEYAIINKDYRKNYANKRNSIDPLYRLTCNIRSLISYSTKRMGYKKTSKTYNILGCSFEDFKQHIESQFTDGMDWDNRSEWHLDHIYPVSLATDETHLIKLNHYTNFQPLWAIDNIKKGNKLNHFS
jgi:hypothetical protein